MNNFEDMSPADQFMFGYLERDDALDDLAKMVGVLELIAVGPRPDGTWNRDREACRRLAVQALQVLRRNREETLSQKLAKAGFKRRPTWRSLPSDE